MVAILLMVAPMGPRLLLRMLAASSRSSAMVSICRQAEASALDTSQRMDQQLLEILSKTV